MGKSLLGEIVRFDGGIADDPREAPANTGALIKHFDIYSNPKKLTPRRSSEADTSTNVSATDAKQYDLRHFTLGSDGKEYALAKIVATGYPKMVKKTDPTTGNWLSSAGNNISTAEGEGNAARILGSFKEWASAFYFFQGTNQLAKCTLAGVITNTVATVSASILTVAQGVVGADGNFYDFYNNKVLRIAPDGTVTDDVLTALPSNMRIVSVTRIGSLLAIGMAFGTSATAIPVGPSVVYLWDMVTTDTVYDVLDWGEGALQVLGLVEGMLVGVSDKYLSSSLGLARGSMVIRTWSGGTPQVFAEYVSNQTVTLGRFLQDVVIKNNKMFWVASVPFGLSTSTESTFHLGIWCFGRKKEGANFSVTIDTIEEAIDTANFKINSFGAGGDYWFINHSADGSVTKTNDAAAYAETSIFDTPIINDGDSSVTKKLVLGKLKFPPLPSGGQLVLKYRRDAETSYTTIFTYTTADGISHSAINIESSKAALGQYKELQFRAESTGGAEVSGIGWKSEVIDKDIAS